MKKKVLKAFKNRFKDAVEQQGFSVASAFVWKLPMFQYYLGKGVVNIFELEKVAIDVLGEIKKEVRS